MTVTSPTAGRDSGEPTPAVAGIMAETGCSPEAAELVLAARVAATRSHSPYSHFAVGAAVAHHDGAVSLGTNVENASYGLTVCAERCALFAAVALGRAPGIMLALTCSDGDPDRPRTLMPCGACRQVMAELLDPDATVIVDRVGVYRLDELLPEAFAFSR